MLPDANTFVGVPADVFQWSVVLGLTEVVSLLVGTAFVYCTFCVSVTVTVSRQHTLVQHYQSCLSRHQ
jgi:hypothetical protein